MNNQQSGFDLALVQSLLIQGIDIGLVFALAYLVLVIVGERRTLWMVRGFIILMLAAAVSNWAGLRLLHVALNSLVTGSAVAMAVILQSEFRRFLEQLGRGEFRQLFGRDRRPNPEPDSVIDEIVDAVKELSQNRTGALLIIETDSPIDDRDFSVPGLKLNAEVSKELLQTIFQPQTLLHDGAVLIRGSRIVSAGVILPLSDRTASRQLGTRH
ncbi:diadenylate cyclase CdaA, partial [Microcoleus sp. HI-ES]|nr:diadenylate cyclase CdaA [Microcoleus sp. HI-ES]